jgi:hypothetical protein
MSNPSHYVHHEDVFLSSWVFDSLSTALYCVEMTSRSPGLITMTDSRALQIMPYISS